MTAVAEAAPRSPRQYARGASFERTVAKALTQDGYVVARVAASKGSFDLVALKPGQALLVQCKLAGPPVVGPDEWNALWDDAQRAAAVPVVASRPKRGQIAYHLITAAKTGVRGVRPPCQPWTPDDLSATRGGASA